MAERGPGRAPRCRGAKGGRVGFPPADTGQSLWGRWGYQRRGCSGDRRNMAKGQKPGLVSPPDGVTPLSLRSGSDIPFQNGQPSPQSQGLVASQHELGSLAQCPRPPVQLCPLPSMGTPPAGSPEAPPSSVLATPPSQQVLRPLPSQAAHPVPWQGLSSAQLQFGEIQGSGGLLSSAQPRPP